MRIACALLLLSIANGCGTPAKPPEAEPTAPPATAEPAASGEPEASAQVSDGSRPSTAPEATSAPSAAPEASAAESDSEALARDLVKSGGRRIGYSSKKKGFAVPRQARTGASVSLDVLFTDESGHAKDTVRICQAGECDEKLAELAKAAIPKLAERLSNDGYVSVRAIGWPQGRDDLEVGSLGGKLELKGGTLSLAKGGKSSRLGAVHPAKLLAVFVVPDDKLLGLFASADGEPVGQEFSVLKLP